MSDSVMPWDGLACFKKACRPEGAGATAMLEVELEATVRERFVVGGSVLVVVGREAAGSVGGTRVVDGALGAVGS